MNVATALDLLGATNPGYWRRGWRAPCPACGEPEGLRLFRDASGTIVATSTDMCDRSAVRAAFATRAAASTTEASS